MLLRKGIFRKKMGAFENWKHESRHETFYSGVRRQNWRNLSESRAKPGEKKLKNLEYKFRGSIIQLGKIGNREWKGGTSNKIIQNIFSKLTDKCTNRGHMNFQHDRSKSTRTKALALWNFLTLRKNYREENNKSKNLEIDRRLVNSNTGSETSVKHTTCRFLRENSNPPRSP